MSPQWVSTTVSPLLLFCPPSPLLSSSSSAQIHGFTCGVSDLLLTAPSEAQRSLILSQAEAVGNEVAAKFVGVASSGAGGMQGRG